MQDLARKLSNDLVGVAGVHFVVMKLTLRGLVALPTVRNTAGIDVLVAELDSGDQAFLQVKTSMQKVTFWPTSRPERCIKGANAFYVFLRYLPREETFEAFLESGDEVVRQVTENWQDHMRRGRKEFPYWRLPSNETDQQLLRRSWETWRPPAA